MEEWIRSRTPRIHKYCRIFLLACQRLSSQPVHRVRFRRASNSEAVDYAAVLQVLFDYLVHVFPVHPGVPHPLRIDDAYGAFTAAVQTACRIDSRPAGSGNAELFGAFLGVIAHGLRVEVLTAFRPLFALVGAEEQVIAVVRLVHGCGRDQVVG